MITLISSFFALLAVGVPIALVLAGTSLLYIVVVTDVPLTIVPQRLFVGTDDFTLVAIPLFILAGFLMNETGITARLVYFASLLLRRVYAALAQTNVVVSMVFGGITGVGAADVAAVGTVMIPAMEKEGYEREYATAITLASSLMGPIIPPSIPLIIYGIQSETSIGALFLAGAIPGVLIGLTLIVLNVVLLKRRGFDARRVQPARPSGKELSGALVGALVGLMMPVVIIGGIVGGVFTPTEAAGVAVGYALLAGFVFFRTLNLVRLAKAVVEAAITSAVVMLIVVTSVLLNWVLAFSQLPTKVADLFLGLTSNTAVFLLIVIVLLMIIGMPLDPVPGLIIMTPVLLPSALNYGIDPVHFGVVIVMTLVIGMLTPPVGGSLFVASAISKISIVRLSWVVLPFLGGLLLLTLVLAYVPIISLWLPRAFGPG